MARIAKVSKALKTLKFLKVFRIARTVNQLSSASGGFVDALESIKGVLPALLGFLALSMLSHVHGCIWALTQADMVGQEDTDKALNGYYISFRWAFNAFTVGSVGGESPEGTWPVEMLVGSERLVLGAVFGAYGLVKAFAALTYRAELSEIRKAALRYFRLHKLSAETQVSVLYTLEETQDQHVMHRQVEVLMSKYLGDELRHQLI